MRIFLNISLIVLMSGSLAAQTIKHEWQTSSARVNVNYQKYLVNRILELHNPDRKVSSAAERHPASRTDL